MQLLQHFQSQTTKAYRVDWIPGGCRQQSVRERRVPQSDCLPQNITLVLLCMKPLSRSPNEGTREIRMWSTLEGREWNYAEDYQRIQIVQHSESSSMPLVYRWSTLCDHLWSNRHCPSVIMLLMTIPIRHKSVINCGYKLSSRILTGIPWIDSLVFENWHSLELTTLGGLLEAFQFSLIKAQREMPYAAWEVPQPCVLAGNHCERRPTVRWSC